ncbi:hypothetical protein V512_007525 [Mesotoga sp. Brook.08.105.5.1]|nr:hypothetical protein V512_007525 [Mesotoga sp. Brook.08.105.5.1]RAO95656.1 hypothetical protein M388_03950 [Mesotoga sp. Brook.08.YT.4.2.5.4.]
MFTYEHTIALKIGKCVLATDFVNENHLAAFLQVLNVIFQRLFESANIAYPAPTRASILTPTMRSGMKPFSSSARITPTELHLLLLHLPEPMLFSFRHL